MLNSFTVGTKYYVESSTIGNYNLVTKILKSQSFSYHIVKEIILVTRIARNQFFVLHSGEGTSGYQKLTPQGSGDQN
jgi:hypothetical protein